MHMHALVNARVISNLTIVCKDARHACMLACFAYACVICVKSACMYACACVCQFITFLLSVLGSVWPHSCSCTCLYTILMHACVCVTGMAYHTHDTEDTPKIHWVSMGSVLT
jgi:hypothetical protein